MIDGKKCFKAQGVNVNMDWALVNCIVQCVGRMACSAGENWS